MEIGIRVGSLNTFEENFLVTYELTFLSSKDEKVIKNVDIKVLIPPGTEDVKMFVENSISKDVESMVGNKVDKFQWF